MDVDRDLEVLEPAPGHMISRRRALVPLDTAAAFTTGWHAFRAHWGWLVFGQLALITSLALVVGSGAVTAAGASLFRERGDQIVWTGITVPGLIVAIMLWSAAWVGLAWLALRAVRGQAIAAPNWRAGLRRMPAIVGGRLVTGLALLALLGVGGAASPLLLRGARAIGGLLQIGADPLWLWFIALSVLAAGWGMLWVAGVWTVQASLVVGVVLWPFALADGRPARDGWRLLTGQRWPATGLCLALVMLNVLGLLAFGLGILVTGAISVTVLAAAYEQLVTEPTIEEAPAGDSRSEISLADDFGPVPVAATRPWLRWVLDGYLTFWLLYLAAVMPVVGLARPVVDALKQNSGLRPQLFTIVLLVGALIGLGTLLLGYRRVHPTPGTRLAATGWGPFAWLAVLLAVLVLSLAVVVTTGWFMALLGTLRMAPSGG